MLDMEDQVINYLSKRRFLTLATSTIDGKPLTHPVAYVNIEATTYFATSKETRKIKNIKENPTIAYSIYDNTEYMDEVRSVQMEGEASIIEDKIESDKILKMLNKKFPIMAEMPKDYEDVVVKLTPKICYFIDYTKGFQNRDRVEFK